jgi:hypothetical protein
MILEAFGKSEISGYISAAIAGGLGTAILLRCDWTRKPNGKLRFWPFFFGLFFIVSVTQTVASEFAQFAKHFHF